MDDMQVDKAIREYPFGIDGWTWEMWDKAKADHPNERHSLWLQVNGSEALSDNDNVRRTFPQGTRFREAHVDQEDPMEPWCHLHSPWTGMPGSMSEALKMRKHPVYASAQNTLSLLEVHVQIHRDQPKWRAMDTIKRQFTESIQHLCHYDDYRYYIEDKCVQQVRDIMHSYNDRLKGQATITVLLSRVL